LKEKYPKKEFIIIMGSDGLKSFHKWRNHETILKNHEIFVYPRYGSSDKDFIHNAHISSVEAPKMEISSSFIRKAIKEGKDIRHFLSPDVYKYIIEMHFYKD
jgi:nicotinate-nucleotide adenylyltransferase